MPHARLRTWLPSLLFLACAAARSAAELPDGIQVAARAAGPSLPMHDRRPLRSLQDAPLQGPTVVTQPLDLQAAVGRGDTHIQVAAHLDLSSLEVQYGPLSGSTSFETKENGFGELLGDVPASVKSIRGNCSTSAPSFTGSPPLLPLRPQQCLLVVDVDALELRSALGSLWLDNLYLRVRRTASQRDKGAVLLIVAKLQAKLWMTRVTMQGDVESTGLELFSGGSVYAEECTFSNLGNSYDVVKLDGATAALVNSTFEGNAVNPTEGVAIVHLVADSSLLLRRSSFSGNSALHELVFSAPTGEVFMEDSDVQVFDVASGTVVEGNSTATMTAAQQAQFLSATDPWFLNTQQEVLEIAGIPGPVTDPAASPNATTDSTTQAPATGCASPPCNEGPSVALIAGLAAAAAAVLASVVTAGILLMKRRSTRRAVPTGSTEHQVAQGHNDKHGPPNSGTPSATPPHARLVASSQEALSPLVHLPTASAGTTSSAPPSSHLFDTTTTASQLSADARPRPQSTPTPPAAARGHSGAAQAGHHSELPAWGADWARGTQSGTIDTVGPEAIQDRAPPPSSAPAGEHLEFLQHQLDISEGHEVLPGLVLQPGMASRVQGGQAIVQFAKDVRNSLEYAAKFFVSRRAFEDEKALYMDESNPLGRFLPQLRNILDDQEAAVRDSRGRPFPACIIMEKGESLDLWSRRNNDVDMFAIMQVIHNVAQRLGSMHDCGYVHRDLKQSNIMWLPRTNRWTLIDFGCAAKAGEEAPLSYSLAYAAPEVVRAVQAGQRSIVAEKAMDAWALGIVAVELFSNSPALNTFEGKETVMQRILGELPLPWEAGAPEAKAVLRSMGRLHADVLALLHRDPAERISMHTFVKRCRSIYAQTSVAV